MKVLWSFNKQGYEADCWAKEISAASTPEVTFIPFNHGNHVAISGMMNAWQLDTLYRNRSPQLQRLHEALHAALTSSAADILCVTNCPPYHPDFLRTLPVYKALYSTDDPEATYKRTIPYLHAYDHVLFCAPGYSADMTMLEKMKSAGMANADWLPLGVFDFERDPSTDGGGPFQHARDIDIVYVGAFWRQKIDTLMRVNRAFGRGFAMRGVFLVRHNAYINMRYGAWRWVRRVSFQDRVRLYQRAKIGINLHWNEHGLGNQRLYHLPANGVMQLTDCPLYAGQVFDTGREIVTFDSTSQLIDQLRWYLQHDAERLAIAERGHARVMRDYRIATVLHTAVQHLRRGWSSRRWTAAKSS